MSVFDLVYQDPQYYPQPTTFLCERLPADLTGQSVVDLGCGNGRNALELLRRGARVIATDLSATGIESLSKQAESRGLDGNLDASVGSIPVLADRRVDGLVLSTVLDHMGREEALAALEKLALTLAGDAWVYASVFTVDDPGSSDQSTSETSSGVVTYWEPLDFASEVTGRLRCRLASLSVDWMVDTSHGPSHLHHLLRLFAIRGQPAVRRVVDDKLT
jgi:SAM-dependent methyltransferase